MARCPAFWFYPKDWMGDTQLQMARSATRGVWINLLCAMWWAPERGQLQGTEAELSRLANCTTKEFRRFLVDNSRHKFADVTDNHNGITLENRRMMREEKARKSNRLRQSRFRLRNDNTEITPPSSSTSSTPSTSKKPPIVPLGGTEANASRRTAVEILGWLNQKAGKNFRETDTNLKFILARLKEKVTPEQLKAIVSRKVREWGTDPERRMYLRPATLFNKTKCEQYFGELPRIEEPDAGVS